MDREGQNAMGRVFHIPWVGGQNTMGSGIKISCTGVLYTMGSSGKNTMDRGSKYHG